MSMTSYLYDKKLPTSQAFSARGSRQVLATAGAVSPQDLLKKPESPSTGRRKKVQTNVAGLEADVVQQRIISVDNKIQQERARTSQLERQLREIQSDIAAPSPTISTRTASPGSAKQKKVAVRVSSPGVVLRRGSQVEVVSRRARRYGNARELEDELIRTEDELLATRKELGKTADMLDDTKRTLEGRTKDLEKTQEKVTVLMGMVKELMQHLLEKDAQKRFSMLASEELQGVLQEPLSASFVFDSDSHDYVNEKIKSMTKLLPQWENALVDFKAVVDAAEQKASSPTPPRPPSTGGRGAAPPLPSAFAGNADELPPPIPVDMLPNRGGAPHALTFRAHSLEEALKLFWESLDSENDGVLTLRELASALERIQVSREIRDAIHDAVSESILRHEDGSGAFGPHDFTAAIVESHDSLIMEWRSQFWEKI
eukprot:g2905.t1